MWLKARPAKWELAHRAEATQVGRLEATKAKWLGSLVGQRALWRGQICLKRTFLLLFFAVASSHNGWTIFQPDLLVFISPITWFGPTTIGLSARTSSPGKTVREATWKRKTYTWFRTWYLSNCLHSQTLDRLYLTRKSVTRDILKHTCALFVNLKHAQVTPFCK